MSFSTHYNSLPIAPFAQNGGSLTITNPTPGTAVMNWSFPQPYNLTSGVIIEDVVHRQTVVNTLVSGNSYTATGLSSGTYRFTVSNGSNFIIIDDSVID